MERRSGKIEKVEFPENVITSCDKIEYLKKNGYSVGKFEIYSNDYVYFEDDDYILIKNGDIYDWYFMITDEELDADECYYKARKLNNGVIEYDVFYYNGGESLNDAIGEALKTLSND
jgi:hypothetical protein